MYSWLSPSIIWRTPKNSQRPKRSRRKKARKNNSSSSRRRWSPSNRIPTDPRWTSATRAGIPTPNCERYLITFLLLLYFLCEASSLIHIFRWFPATKVVKVSKKRRSLGGESALLRLLHHGGDLAVEHSARRGGPGERLESAQHDTQLLRLRLHGRLHDRDDPQDHRSRYHTASGLVSARVLELHGRYSGGVRGRVVRLRHDRRRGRRLREQKPVDHQVAASVASATTPQDDQARAQAQGGLRLCCEQFEKRH
ncbi:unnamed protein product [Trichogramma brassicae]|uniref:Uncharacterized protein n=1 Tax=Trichogramma brassicae TaxID=86971 RepID=A0A6H5J833_9HYME|nr:unnamed protein product [Trichogramma brassicae]